MPDTSLLKPLADALGVSVTELLSGRRMEETETRVETDRLLIASLDYAKRTSVSTIRALLYIFGIAFLISPLFVTGRSYLWYLGLVITAVAVCFPQIRKRIGMFKWSEKVIYITALAVQGTAFVLELLPYGVPMEFAPGPDKRIIKTYSYFSLIPMGYANITPMLTGLLTVAVLLMGVVALFRFDRFRRIRKMAFVCDSIGVVFSFVPLLLLGIDGMTTVSFVVSAALILSVCLQAVANRNG